MKRSLSHCQSKAYEVSSAPLVVHEPICGTAETGGTVETTATDDAEIGRGTRRGAAAIPALTPFPYIARHVIKTQLVGLQRSHRDAATIAAVRA